MKAFVFPGQGAQFVGMGKDLYENNPVAKEMFDKANEILGFNITDLISYSIFKLSFPTAGNPDKEKSLEFFERTC